MSKQGSKPPELDEKTGLTLNQVSQPSIQGPHERVAFLDMHRRTLQVSSANLVHWIFARGGAGILGCIAHFLQRLRQKGLPAAQIKVTTQAAAKIGTLPQDAQGE